MLQFENLAAIIWLSHITEVAFFSDKVLCEQRGLAMFRSLKTMLWLLALVASAFLIGAGILGSWALQNKKWLILGICIVVGGASGSFETRIALALQKSSIYQVVKEVYGNLEAAYHLAGFTSAERITLYVPHRRNPNVLIQIVPYVPTKKLGPFKKGLDISKGITGLCFRTRERKLDILKRSGDFRNYMIAQYGFTQAEANMLEGDRKSYLAIPVFNRENKAAGVVFCDSTRERAFTEQAIDLITRVCIPVAEYV
ncbi:hypothetical protein ES708_01205 [subsurface metagenome]